jgi:AraC-like DNA-binding protein
VDPLNQLVELLRPRAFAWKRLAAHDSWAWRMPANPGVVFGKVISGSCKFEIPGHAPQDATAGDCLLLVTPEPWMLSSGDGEAEATDFDDTGVADAAPADVDPQADSPVRMVGGHFAFEPHNSDLLTSLLSPIVHIRARESGDGGLLERLLGLIDLEVVGDRPGQQAVLSRIMEIVLIDALRTPEIITDQRSGMLNGLTDPDIARALSAFHADIGQRWSVESMASVARMSRSTFSRRFTSLVGKAPMTYALQWRMAVARQELADGSRSVNEIARRAGYGSSSAFSTAFARETGKAPLRYAQHSRHNE